MKLIRKICRPDKAMSEYLKKNDPDCNELLYITDWNGGKVYSATNKKRRTSNPKPAVGRGCLLLQTENSISEIWEDRNPEAHIEIFLKWARENGLPEDFDDYEEEFIFED